MYAVVKTGGKQYKLSEGDLVRVEKLAGEIGDEITLDEVLMTGSEGEIKVGHPLLEGAVVKAKITDQNKAKKIMVLHKKRRKGYRKLQGHRQPFTELKIIGIDA